MSGKILRDIKTSKSEIKTMTKKKEKDKKKTTLYKTQHRKIKTEQYEPHPKY